MATSSSLSPGALRAPEYVPAIIGLSEPSNVRAPRLGPSASDVPTRLSPGTDLMSARGCDSCSDGLAFPSGDHLTAAWRGIRAHLPNSFAEAVSRRLAIALSLSLAPAAALSEAPEVPSPVRWPPTADASVGDERLAGADAGGPGPWPSFHRPGAAGFTGTYPPWSPY